MTENTVIRLKKESAVEGVKYVNTYFALGVLVAAVGGFIAYLSYESVDAGIKFGLFLNGAFLTAAFRRAVFTWIAQQASVDSLFKNTPAAVVSLVGFGLLTATNLVWFGTLTVNDNIIIILFANNLFLVNLIFGGTAEEIGFLWKNRNTQAFATLGVNTPATGLVTVNKMSKLYAIYTVLVTVCFMGYCLAM